MAFNCTTPGSVLGYARLPHWVDRVLIYTDTSPTHALVLLYSVALRRLPNHNLTTPMHVAPRSHDLVGRCTPQPTSEGSHSYQKPRHILC